ncbi:PREDICTED: vegetative cell wall protein gp1-like, partial [Chinchilla lanigera]|uniref:vegetative cell wall protein gp1-like n=1 Tax=Chinchilla lanigera TaxID=34839 RepID=UPI00069712CA
SGAFPASWAGGLFHPLPPGPAPGAGAERADWRAAAAPCPLARASGESSPPPPSAGSAGGPGCLSRGHSRHAAVPTQITKRGPRSAGPRCRSPSRRLPPHAPRVRDPPPGLRGPCPARPLLPRSDRAARRAERPCPPKWELVPRPASPRVPLSEGKELSAHTSCETRVGGGVSEPGAARLGVLGAREGRGVAPELPGASVGAGPLFLKDTAQARKRKEKKKSPLQT